MRVIASADQLNGNVNGIAQSLDAAFKDGSNTEFLRNSFQIIGSTLVFCRRSLGNHLKITDLRQGGQDLVLHAGHEISVRLVVAQIFEWKNSDALFDDW